ncbi:MAG: hypothetical protein L0H59_00395 [Tomitella sp.]|nr:hypothetical protein [Tomitella sp.]
MTTLATSRLWQPVDLGAVSLRHRLVLAPLTRRRAAEDGTPTPLMAEYYAQRSGFGLVITEGIYPSREGRLPEPARPGRRPARTRLGRRHRGGARPRNADLRPAHARRPCHQP